MIKIDNNFEFLVRVPVPDEQIQGIQIKKTNATSSSFSALSLPLSNEEKERQLHAVDNSVKIAVLNRSGNSTSPSEQIGVTTGWDERHHFIEKLYNLTLNEFEKLKVLGNGVTFVSGLDITTAEALESTPENPIMYVASGNTNVEPSTLTWYKVYVNQVNPASATREEMLAFITHTYRDASDETLLQVTNAWRGMDPCALNNGDNGRINFADDLKYCFESAKKAFTSGDIRSKEAYDALTDMIDKIRGYADQQSAHQQTKPSQATIYHKIATAKLEVQEKHP